MSTHQAEISSSGNPDLASGLIDLGVQLNTTIRRVIREAPQNILLKALESLKEASTENRVENPSGFFYRAVADAWKPNEGQEQRNVNTALSEWYPLAHRAGVVQAATQIEGVQCVLLQGGDWISLADAVQMYPSEQLESLEHH